MMRKRFFGEAPEAFKGVFGTGEESSTPFGPAGASADPYAGRSSVADAPPVLRDHSASTPKGVFRRPSLSWLPTKGDAPNKEAASTQMGQIDASLCTPSRIPSSGGDAASAASRGSTATGGAAKSSRKSGAAPPESTSEAAAADKASANGRGAPSTAAAKAAAKAGATQDGPSIPLLDNPMSVVTEHPDVGPNSPRSNQPPFNPVRATASQYELTGILLKRSGDGDKRLLNAVNNVREGWLERFFELKDGQLLYWKLEADYFKGERGKPEPALEMHEYEVLVDTRDPHWGFILQPKNAEGGLRGWHLRARSESERMAWSQKLLLASMLPNN